MLCVCDDTIYVGSRTEGISGGWYYSGEESDIDAILPFFEEYDVHDAQFYLDEGIEKPNINENPWIYFTGYYTLLCSRKTFFAFYDEKFPGYMNIYCLPNTSFSSSKEPARADHVYIENKSFQNLVRKTDAQDLNITTETTNQFQTNGPAVTERCFSSSFLFSKYESLVSDNIPCLYFDYWPPCAYDWTIRFKPNGWPKDEIINQIVSQKCMLAPVGHHDSSNKDVQFRLSVTGENLLFKHLNQVQVYCYILLKIILKDKLRPILTSDNKDILSSYCMKNVVFWCVERESVDWTVSNLVRCLQLCVGKLIFYLQEHCLPHYIIKGRNLLNSILKSDNSKLLQTVLLHLNQNVSDILQLKSFEMVRLKSRGFQPELLASLIERSVIYNFWSAKIVRLFHDFSTFEFFWLHYDRQPSLKSIDKYEDILCEIESYECKTIFKKDYSMMIKSIIGLLSYSLYRRNSAYKETFETKGMLLIEGTKTSRPCILLRLATFYLMEQQFNCVLKICVDVIRKEIKITPPKQIWNQIYKSNGKLCILLLQLELGQKRLLKEAILAASYSLPLASIYRQFLSSDANYILDEFENGMLVNPYFKVTYMTAELWAVPDVLQLELLSVPNRLKKFNADKFPCPKYDQVPCLRIHPLLNCYLLMYLSYDGLGKKTQRNDVLNKINSLRADEIAVENNQVLFYNILVYCNSKTGHECDKKRAAKYVVRSLKKFPSRCNAAFGYLKDIVQQSLTLIRTWKANA
ncbi:Hypothetical predicted protein [Mytilus galloprovincialis]|uniref:Mab-21-like HhH/H2TH-like domain-containing protein n=1 Tax=Mytilus galloprovincialis TaxID=29158 RepID=A0A8B6DMN5_MYTGA|nr:Hypothetical predicted protein [Mytilus galloprovincialis]